MQSLKSFSYDANLKVGIYSLFRKTGDFLKSFPSLIQQKSIIAKPLLFDKCLDHFIYLFLERGYLDENNAELMKSLLSGNQLPDDHLIQWKRKHFSLLNFIFFADKLDYFNESCRTEEHDYYPRLEVPFSAIILNNFRTSDGAILAHYTNSKNWKLIHTTLIELKNKVSKEKDFKNTKPDNPYHDIINYCFEKGIPFTLEYKKKYCKIDTDMVDIVYEVWKRTKM